MAFSQFDVFSEIAISEPLTYYHVNFYDENNWRIITVYGMAQLRLSYEHVTNNEGIMCDVMTREKSGSIFDKK